MSKELEFYIPQIIKYRLYDKSIKKNGCGSGWNALLVPDSIFGFDFTIPCAIHDEMYAVGKTLEDKNEADRVFFNNMMRVVESKSWWKQSLGKWLATKYYNTVVDYGAIAYWKGKNNPENVALAYIGVGINATQTVIKLKKRLVA